MKKLIGISILALSLAGCATGPGSSGNLSNTAKQIQDTTRTICKFVPTLTTIANILSSGAVGTIGTIANDICAAVTTIPLADGGPRSAKVYGVPLKGKFVR